jgi:ubiquinone/menaquinone biosynthesis C-methylase UbiE
MPSRLGQSVLTPSEVGQPQPRTGDMPIAVVRDFWDSEPCGVNLSPSHDRQVYMAETAKLRYKLEPHIPGIARFAAFENKDVLEIGCGIGADAASFAAAGARYIGVDVSRESAKLANERLRIQQLRGDVLVANAEELPFRDERFDHVYSFGVLHHSPRTEAIAGEIRRVLRRNGTFCVMLYNKSSINYWVEIMALRRLLRWLLIPPFAPEVISRVTGLPRRTLDGHRAALQKKMSKAEWISMNTDGPLCPLAKVYSASESLALFRGFTDVRTEVYYFNASHWPVIGRLVPSQFVGRRWGWHRIVRGVRV